MQISPKSSLNLSLIIESNQINYLLIIQKLRFVRVIKDSYIYKI